ncbi:MAG: TraB/GumN family protein [Prevotella sp.]|nr:TraB/GumN family protein [Prevotella sp.]
MKFISKTYLLRLFFVLSQLSPLACFGQEPICNQISEITDSVPDGIFFRISGGGLAEPSYILGTLHTIPGDFVHRIPGFHEAANSVQQFIFERDLASTLRQIPLLQDTTFLNSLTIRNDSLFRYEGCDSLHNPYIEDLEPSLYQLVCRTMTKDFDMADFYMHSATHNTTCLQQQYFVAIKRLTSEMGVPLQRIDYPIDFYVADSIARPRDASIVELDTAFVFANPDSTYTKFLADENAGLHDRKFYSATLVNNVHYYWLMLYATRLYCEHYFRYEGRATIGNMNEQSEQKIFVERNALWSQRLPALLQQNSSLVVVGLGHLFDRKSTHGLLSTLMREGYTIEALAAPNN